MMNTEVLGKKYDLSISIFDYCYKLAVQRMKQKEKYKSSNPLSENYELVGILGEVIFGLRTGELFDNRLKANGDDGSDFSNRVQVKTSEVHKAKHLIEYTDKDFSKFDWYVFVVVDLKSKNGSIVGYISTKEFLQKKKVINFGYGDRYAIDLKDLHQLK